MPNALSTPRAPCYLSLFPDWAGARPLPFFLMENLLEARAGSCLPTNLAGPDEDVNVYLTGLLGRLLGKADPSLLSRHGGPVLNPPSKARSRRERAEIYRRNGEHRLLMLGLFNRGDDQGRGDGASRSRDRDVGAHCFHAAACLLEGRPGENTALTAIWRKLADRFEEYVQVLSVLATDRWGLGARLSDRDLGALLPPEADAPATMDLLLDLLLEVRQGCQEKRAEVIDLARRLNLDPEQLLRAG